MEPPHESSDHVSAGRRAGEACSAVDVGRAARRLDLMMARLHLELGERMGLSAAEILALAHLSLEGALGPTELVHHLHMTTGAMTALLDRLADRGLIMREPHPSDRRRVVVSLTKEGRQELLGHVHGMADEVIDLTQRLTADERIVIGRFLDDLSELLAHAPGSPGVPPPAEED